MRATILQLQSVSFLIIFVLLLWAPGAHCTQPREGTPCNLGNGNWLLCPPGTVCDVDNQKCSPQVSVPTGHKMCPDGLSYCPNDQECNMEASARGSDRCIPPGSTRCGPPIDPNNPRFGASGTFWCRPGLVCDMKRMMCTEPVKVPPGQHLCPDGLSFCPNGRECNMEAPAGWSDRCLEPGSTRCGPPMDPNASQFGASGTFWCRPGLVCDMKRMMCTEPVKVPPGQHLCPDGLSFCPNGRECNMEAPAGWSDRCLEPGSTRCGPPMDPNASQLGASRTFWCRPGLECDMKRMMCVNPEEQNDRDPSSTSSSGTASQHNASLTVPNDKPVKVYTPFATSVGKDYVITASGVVSDWSDKSDGVDAVWCYAAWRCGKGEMWQQLRIDGKGMSDYNDKPITYAPSHTYSIEIRGTGKPIEFYMSDAQGSASDNKGAIQVTITEKP